MNEPPRKISDGHKKNVKYLEMTLVPDKFAEQEWPQGNWWKIKGHGDRKLEGWKCVSVVAESLSKQMPMIR